MTYQELYEKRLEEAAAGKRSNVGEHVFHEYCIDKGISLEIPSIKNNTSGYKFRLVRRKGGEIIKTHQKISEFLLLMAKGNIIQYSRTPDFVNVDLKEHIIHKRQKQKGGSQDLSLKEELEILRMWEDYIIQFPANGWRMIWVADGKRYNNIEFDEIKDAWNINNKNTEITNGENYCRTRR